MVYSRLSYDLDVRNQIVARRAGPRKGADGLDDERWCRPITLPTSSGSTCTSMSEVPSPSVTSIAIASGLSTSAATQVLA